MLIHLIIVTYGFGMYAYLYIELERITVVLEGLYLLYCLFVGVLDVGFFTTSNHLVFLLLIQ